MKYNFDEIPNRIGTNCAKWDNRRAIFGRDDVIPMWIADMDFGVEPAIIKAMEERLKHEVFGYTYSPDSYYKSVIDWMQKRFQWKIEKDWIKFTPGVVPGVNSIIAAFTKPGDQVILQTPVYHPFYRLIKNNDCEVLENPLVYDGSNYKMDLENLKEIITDKTKMIILCSPHNPGGRVWTMKELKELGEICIENNILVVSDEIHGDIVYKPNKHTVFAQINDEFANNSIICTAPNKTFNIAGLETANIIIQNEKLRKQFEIQLDKHCIHGPNIMGAVALEAAYVNGEQWYNQLMDYLNENVEFVLNYFENKIPKIKVQRPQGTYLLWLDCSKLNMSNDELNKFFINKCKVGLNNGKMFGHAGEQFQRMNIGTSRKIIEEALKRIENAINSL
ncbi:pyridoxal phosphate-dependent aminotransferase [Clostridium senegalense]|uniref:MalY/PatB family protein n=1 Tax=Clostridium senegalense TaxID=1465809 RepID=UPI001C0F7F66|nr:MalY/PatB family protein [Clostridium senegalense]MBU5225897.1 pyridoxal phosphate-dependent aminotransferase [Clostridium senegalense]